MTVDRGRVVWITGLSGAGKTTVARRLAELFRERGLPCALLDGDEVRRAVGDATCGHDKQSRLVNAYRICRLARLLAGQGLTVIVATMSLFHEIHDWNRAHLPGYFEAVLEADLEVLRRRDPKGLYGKAAAGLERNLVGLDLAPEHPRSPDLVLSNSGHLDDVTPVAEAVLDAVLKSRSKEPPHA